MTFKVVRQATYRPVQYQKAIEFITGGGVAQMVERSLSMREVPGSIPGASKNLFAKIFFDPFTVKWIIELNGFLEILRQLSGNFIIEKYL